MLCIGYIVYSVRFNQLTLKFRYADKVAEKLCSKTRQGDILWGIILSGLMPEIVKIVSRTVKAKKKHTRNKTHTHTSTRAKEL